MHLHTIKYHAKGCQGFDSCESTPQCVKLSGATHWDINVPAEQQQCYINQKKMMSRLFQNAGLCSL